MFAGGGNFPGGNSSPELDYVVANRFYVEIEGMVRACFTECSGLGVSITKKYDSTSGVFYEQPFTLEYNSYHDVTMKRGVTSDTQFGQWIINTLRGGESSGYSGATQGIGGMVNQLKNNPLTGLVTGDRGTFMQSNNKAFTRKDISILLFNQAGDTVQTWTLKNAIAIKWMAPVLQANSNQLAIEELTFAYEALELTPSGSSATENTAFLGWF